METKTYFYKLAIQDGESNYTIKLVAELPKRKSIKAHAENTAKTFFFSKSETEIMGGQKLYNFSNGKSTWVTDYEEIPRVDFDVLSKYLSVI